MQLPNWASYSGSQRVRRERQEWLRRQKAQLLQRRHEREDLERIQNELRCMSRASFDKSQKCCIL
jgi:hypothetical protein